MATRFPPNAQTDVQQKLGAYQYSNMRRYVPTQMRAWSGPSQGNSYSMKNWRTAEDVNNANLMQSEKTHGRQWQGADMARQNQFMDWWNTYAGHPENYMFKGQQGGTSGTNLL